MKVVQTTVPATPTGPAVPGLLVQPHNAFALMLFGHGAGTPMRAPLMNQLSETLASHPNHPIIPASRHPGVPSRDPAAPNTPSSPRSPITQPSRAHKPIVATQPLRPTSTTATKAPR